MFNKLLFVDIKTTGLSHLKDSIIEIGAVLTDLDATRIIHKFNIKVFPKSLITKEAAEINGYTQLKWRNAKVYTIKRAIGVLSKFSKDTMLVTHNAPFDRAFINTALFDNNINWLGDYHTIDTATLAWPLLTHNYIPNLKLDTILKFFALEPETVPHIAINGALKCMAIYRKLMPQFIEF
jgi:DNA polymerase-3 subunit epsilon